LQKGYGFRREYPWRGVGLGNFVSPDLGSNIAAVSGYPGYILFLLSFGYLIFRGITDAITRKLTFANLPHYVSVAAIFASCVTGLGHFNLVWPWTMFGVASYNAIPKVVRRSSQHYKPLVMNAPEETLQAI